MTSKTRQTRQYKQAKDKTRQDKQDKSIDKQYNDKTRQDKQDKTSNKTRQADKTRQTINDRSLRLLGVTGGGGEGRDNEVDGMDEDREWMVL
jgi:amino acid permease